MKRYLIFFLLIIRQLFSGEVTGGDKIETDKLKSLEEKGELTGVGIRVDSSNEIK